MPGCVRHSRTQESVIAELHRHVCRVRRGGGRAGDSGEQQHGEESLAARRARRRVETARCACELVAHRAGISFFCSSALSRSSLVIEPPPVAAQQQAALQLLHRPPVRPWYAYNSDLRAWKKHPPDQSSNGQFRCVQQNTIDFPINKERDHLLSSVPSLPPPQCAPSASPPWPPRLSPV